MKFEYAIFNILIFTFSTLGSLFKHSYTLSKLKAVLLSILSISTFFIIWDSIVTGSWWYFNSKYISGVIVGTLPIEEIAFFFVIPWSCLIIWEYIQKKIHGSWNFSVAAILFILFCFTGFASYYMYKWYLLTVSVFSLLALIIDSRSDRPLYSLKSFTIFTVINLFLTFICNGYLTFRPVVIYNPAIITNMRIFTIPIEDFVYGQLLLYLTVILYEKNKKYF